MFNKNTSGEDKILNKSGCGLGMAISNNLARNLGPKN